MPNKSQIKQKMEKEREYRLRRNNDLIKEQEKITRAMKDNNNKLQSLMATIVGV